MRIITVFVAGATMAMAVASVVPARAQQSAVCRQLMADYARVSGQGGGANAALQRQAAEVQRAQADYDRLCGFSLFSRPAPQCPQIAQRITQMQANLQQLQGRSARVAPPPEQERAAIIAQLRANGCQPGSAVPQPVATPGRAYQAPDGSKYFSLPGPDGPVQYRESPNGTVTRVAPDEARRTATQTPPGLRPQPQEGGLFGAIFGPGPQAPVQAPPGVDDPYADPWAEGAGGGGSYRTLCVRTCDGFYFPVSNATSSDRFSTDTEICRARCPASETRLFAQRSGTESEEAVAADDLQTPYAKMSYALKYRTEVVKGCTCGTPDAARLAALTAQDTGRRGNAALALPPDLTLPDAKPRFDDDPDSRWNEQAKFVPAFGPLAVKSAEATPKKDVRVVGPKFYISR